MDERQPKISHNQESTHIEGLSQRQAKRLLTGNFEAGKEETFLCTHKNQSPDHRHAITESVKIYGHLARMVSKGKQGLLEESLGLERPGEAHPRIGKKRWRGASTPHRDYLSARYCACG